MSELRVDSVKSKGGGAPDLPKGVTISGIATAATLGVTNVDGTNVNVSGVVTSGTLSGELLSTGTPTLGLGVTINSSGVVISGVATAGIVSATTLYGDGSNITGVGATLAPLFYNPDVSDSLVLVGTGIGITFNQQIKAGTGNITIRETNASGTVVENFGVGSSVTISENRVSFTPTADLSSGTLYYLSYPSGCFTNNEGTDYVGTAYTFLAKPKEYSWWTVGYGDKHAHGTGTETNYSSPVQIPGSWKTFNKGKSSNAGVQGRTILGVKSSGALFGWGSNTYGELGLNNTTSVMSPTQVGSDVDWAGGEISLGRQCFVIKGNGTMYGMGKNYAGALGINIGGGHGVSRSSPCQIPGTTWSQVTGGGSYGLALRTDGTMWSWGYNVYGMLGHNNTTKCSSPVQVTSASNWSQISSGGYNNSAINTDGELWLWGKNNEGQLGQNESNPVQRSSPIQVPGTTWRIASTAEKTTVAIKTDGTLWSWGYNLYGELGIGDAIRRSSPVQVPGTTWSDASFNNSQVIATKTDSTVWAWGQNAYGQLAQNNVVHYSSPVQIAGQEAAFIRSGESHTNWYTEQ